MLERKPGKYYAVGKTGASGRGGSVSEINVRGGERITVVNEQAYSRALNQADRKLVKLVSEQIGRDAKTGSFRSIKGGDRQLVKSAFSFNVRPKK